MAVAAALAGLDLPNIMNSEAMTNAVWNRILHAKFPGPKYLISPEFGFNNGRADLAVILVATMKAVVVYEGKKAGGGINTLVDALGQAVNCINNKGVDVSIAIAGLGTTFDITNKQLADQGTWTKDNTTTPAKKYLHSNLDKMDNYLGTLAAKSWQ